MFTSDPDPTATCSVSLVTDPAQLEKDRGTANDRILDDTVEEKAKDAVVIGHYQLISQLGKGSTGVVWKAVDLGPVRREVALKILHSDYQDDHARIRFTNEVRALACLDDPHIAKVWDDGQTSDGRPYLSMELVPGLSLLKYCDTWSLTIPERIDLVIKICEGIQHAHQRAILHRDLKPANILVALVDGQPVPKVIDFGLAKSLHGPLAPAAIETTQRGCLIGTIGYMSPEQAELDQRDVDVRSDVYAIAAILYELLTGTLPITREELHRHSLTEALKLVREQEPDLPSERVEHEPSGTLHAARCRLSVTALAETLAGDLDAILMKGLSKDRFQRYQSAAELADDLTRYLEGRVVQARKRTYWYVTQKWLRKHWKAACILTTVATLFLISWAMATAGYFVALEERNKARHEEERAKLAKQEEKAVKEDLQLAWDFMIHYVGQSRVDRLGRQATQVDALDASESKLNELDLWPRAACTVRYAMARLYLKHERAAKALTLVHPYVNWDFQSDEDRRQFLAPIQRVYIETLVELGHYQEAVYNAEMFLSQYPRNGETKMVKHRMAVHQQFVLALVELKEFERAKQILDNAIRQPILDEMTNWAARDALLDLLMEWSRVDARQTEVALQMANELLRLAETSIQLQDELIFSVKTKVVTILNNAKQYEQALSTLDELEDMAEYSEAVRKVHPYAQLTIKLARGRIYLRQGRLDDAERLFQECLRTNRDQYGEEHAFIQHLFRSLLDVRVAKHDYLTAVLIYSKLKSLVFDKPERLSKAARQTQDEFKLTLAKASLQWALWAPR